jgi:MATE family multidrug resistance protein
MTNNNSLQVQISNRSILQMALPISLAIFIPQLNFVINNIYLGHYNQDASALAIAGITGVYYLIFAAIGYGLNNGLQTLIARRAGENRPDEVGLLFNQGVYIGMALSMLGIFLTYTATPILFGQLIHDPVICKKAIQFLQIRIWGLPFLYVYQLRNALLVGINQSRLLITGTIAEAVTNVILDYILIFGCWKIPSMGFNGAALASICAEAIGLLVIYAVIHRRGITKQFSLFNQFKWDWLRQQRILSVAAPLMFQHAISIISWQYFFLLIEHHGTMALKVSNVMRNIFGIFGCFCWAFAATANSMVSNLIGQGRQNEVGFLVKKIARISLSLAFAIVIILNIFPMQFLSLFGQGVDFNQAGLPVLRVVSCALVLSSLATILLSTVTASGNTRITFSIEVGAILAYCLYVYLVVEKFHFNIEIGWMSEWLYWLCLLIPSLLYLQSNRWKNRKI